MQLLSCSQNWYKNCVLTVKTLLKSYTSESNMGTFYDSVSNTGCTHWSHFVQNYTLTANFPIKKTEIKLLTQNADYNCTCYIWRDQTETFKVAWKVGGNQKRASVLAQNKACVRLGGKEVSVRGGAGLCGSFYSLPWVWLGFCGFSGRVTAKMQVSYVWSVCANVGDS